MKREYNYELFEKILNHIDEHPQSFNMMTWCQTDECGTTRCIAGLACYLPNTNIPDFRTCSVSSMSDWYFSTARRLLNISITEAEILFYNIEEEDAVGTLEEIVSDKEKEDQRSIARIYNKFQIDH